MLEVREIWKDYEGKSLLRGVSFQVGAGETICLLGASGSGKSTLLRIIAGLEKARSGQVFWQGKDIEPVPVHQRRFGLMFQDYALFPHRTVAENVAFGLRMQGVQREEMQLRVQQALELVNLSSFAHRRVTDLSGGEQQRVALARALAPRPLLLMLDEPLGALDRTLKEEVEEEIRHLLHATNIPAIYVTHDQEEAFAIADRLVLLNHGEVEQIGTPAEVYRQPASIWVANFLGLSNLLRGEVINISPLQVRTGLGIFQGIWQLPGQLPQIGDPVTLLLRAAAIDPTADPFAVNHVRAVVVDCVFRGDGFRVTFLNRDVQSPLSFLLPAPQPVGNEITLCLREDDIQFIKESHD